MDSTAKTASTRLSSLSAKPSRGLQWPILILLLLAGNVCICAITVFAALRSPAQIEPDYYDKALNWDEHREREADK